MAPLRNPRHENFCLAYVAGVDKVEAYRRAFQYQVITKAMHTNAIRLLKSQDIVDRVNELQSDVAEVVVERTGITNAMVVDELAKLAFAEVDLKAITPRDKLGALKILEDRTRPTKLEDQAERNRQSGFIDAPPRETWEEWLERERLDGHGARALAPPARATNGGISSDVD